MTLNDQAWSLVDECEVRISIDASIEMHWTIFCKDVNSASFPLLDVVITLLPPLMPVHPCRYNEMFIKMFLD